MSEFCDKETSKRRLEKYLKKVAQIITKIIMENEKETINFETHKEIEKEACLSAGRDYCPKRRWRMILNWVKNWTDCRYRGLT